MNYIKIRFFIRMLPVFLARVKPASHMAKPACMKKTRAAPSNTQMVFAGEYVMFLTSVSVKIPKKAQGASSTPLRLVGMTAFYAGESRLSR